MYGNSVVSDIVQFGFSIGVAFLVVWGLFYLSRTKKPDQSDRISDDRLVFLIRGDQIVDANVVGQCLVASPDGKPGEMNKLRLFLGTHFSDVETLLTTQAGPDRVLSQSIDGKVQAIRSKIGDTIKLRISFAAASIPVDGDIHTLRAMERELETLRANISAAPFLLWRQNPAGQVTWVNQAYVNVAGKKVGFDAGSWPLPALFPSLRTLPTLKGSESRRLSLTGKGDDAESWYDCHISPLGDDILCTAIPADEAVQSEERRREFTQTLTKTFAELAIGLAIFDRSRRLILFNPALMDLTNLPTDFLASRPSLVGFLDRLRENRVMPEPRDYRSWRTSISELEAAAVDGTYSETWSLPDGQTYHVTGRPHPDGAVALLFEDISAEMSLTRHFRSELEQSQLVLDALDDAVAVFSPNGEFSTANQAYRDLWNIDDVAFQAGDVSDATGLWREHCAPSPIWGDFREFARAQTEREEWSARVAMLDGRRIFCRFRPQKGGGTIAIFRVETAIKTAELQQAV